jgi:endonuclease V-like protein UPF0215 family
MGSEKKHVKSEIRIAGIDDAPFDKFSDRECLAVATIFRGGNYMDGLLSTHVDVDGENATDKILKLIKKTRHYAQLNCIMLNGIALAGFNVVDIQKLHEKSGLPVIVIIRKMPDFTEIRKALSKMRASGKMRVIKKAGKIFRVKLGKKSVFMQTAGISPKKASEIVRISALHSLIPEPIRIAHIIASGIKNGESHGRA